MQYSAHEKAHNEENRRKEHYYDHCERNPLGFLRLKCENFEQDIINENRNIAEELRKDMR